RPATRSGRSLSDPDERALSAPPRDHSRQGFSRLPPEQTRGDSADLPALNGADGIRDIEGKVARVSDEGDGKRPSFKSVAKTLQGSLLRRDTATSMRDARVPQTQKIVSSFVFIRG